MIPKLASALGLAAATLVCAMPAQAAPGTSLALERSGHPVLVGYQSPDVVPVRRHKLRYRVNRYGYGNCVRGGNGSYCGYPAGSAGARELEINHTEKCRVYPESC